MEVTDMMDFPLQVSFRHLSSSRRIESYVRESAARLARHGGHIERCRVVIDLPHHRHRKGNRYVVRIVVFLRSHEIVVVRDSTATRADEDPYGAIHEAFSAAESQVGTLLGKYEARHSNRDPLRIPVPAPRPHGRRRPLEPMEGTLT
jgi:ribosome-associated translation inhibitor RaiA